MIEGQIAAAFGSLFSSGEALFGKFGATVAFLSIGIAVYGAIVGTLYLYLSRRVLYEIKPSKRHAGSRMNTIANVIILISKYTVIFPAITFAWFVLLAGSIFILSRTATIETVFVLSISLVAAVRILAYYKEEIAVDFAKLLPISLLAVVLIDSTLYTRELVEARTTTLSGAVPEFASLIVFVVLLEWVLRIAYVLVKIAGSRLLSKDEPESIWKD